MYAEDSLIFALVLNTCLLGGLLSRYIVNNQLPVPACFKTSGRQAC